MKTKTLKHTGPAARAFLRSARWLGAGLLVGLAGLTAAPGATVTTLGGGPGNGAGSNSGYEDGNTLQVAQFNRPAGISLNSSNNLLYVADQDNNAVRVLDLGAGNTSTFTTSRISQPVAVLVDETNDVYVLNRGTGNNGTIVKYDSFNPPNFLGTNATHLTNATAMCMDGLTNLYVTVQSNRVIRIAPNGVMSTVVTIPSATITTNGTNFVSHNVSLMGIAVLDNGLLAATDVGTHGIWVINPVSQTYRQFSGFNGAGYQPGPPSFAEYNQPTGIANAGGGVMLVTDYGNDNVVTVGPDGTENFFYGIPPSEWFSGEDYPGWFNGENCDNNFGSCAEARNPYGVAVDQAGNVYTTEVYYDIIRETTGTGLKGAPATPPTPPLFDSPDGLAVDNSGTVLYIADKANNTVESLSFDSDTTAPFLTAAEGINQPSDVAFDNDDNLYVLNEGTGGNGTLMEFDESGDLIGTNATGLSMPTALAIDYNGDIFVAEQGGVVQEFSGGASNVIATVTNAGVSLQGIALFGDGTIAVSDAGNDVVWQINPVTHAVTLLTGAVGTPGNAMGTAAVARLNQPHQLGSAGHNQLFAADTANNRIVLIQRSGTITNTLSLTNSEIWYGRPGDPYPNSSPLWVSMISPVGVALGTNGAVYATEDFYGDVRGIFGTGLTQSSLFSDPRGITVDPSGGGLYVADPGNNAVELLNFADNTTTPFLTAADGMNNPSDVTFDDLGNLYVLNEGTGGNGSILEFNVYGNLLATNVTGLSMPTALTVDINGNIYVAEQGGAVQEFSGSISNQIAVITNAGVSLQGIALFDDGTVAVSDAGDDVVWQINPVTQNVTVLSGAVGVPGKGVGTAPFTRLKQPMHLGRASDDQLLVSDSGNNQIVVVERDGSITNVLISTNSTVWFGRSSDPVLPTSPQWVPMSGPSGVALSSVGTVYDSEDVFDNIRGITTGLTPPPKPAPAPEPEIGWVNFTTGQNPVSVLVAGSSFIFNNDVTIAILGSGDSQIYYTYGPTPDASLIPTPSSTNGASAPLYTDGVPANQVPPTIIPTAPDTTIKAVGVNPGSLNSAVVQSRIQFVVANPLISGNNAAQFTVSDGTTGAQLWYTIDGTDPTNATPSLGPITSGATLSLNVTSNLTFKVAGFRTGYAESAIMTTVFSATNFVANTISWGFAGGEASSAFVAAAGQIFYAPVTMTTLTGTKMFSLQFNMTVTNVGNIPEVAPGAYGFQSFLQRIVPGAQNQYVYIPPAEFLPSTTNDMVFTNITFGTNVTGSGGGFVTNIVAITNVTTNLVVILPDEPPSNIVIYPYFFSPTQPFTSLEFENTNDNLLAVAWLERDLFQNLYDTTIQDLIQYSQAHDDQFLQANNQIIVGGYAFQVPPTAAAGDVYQIQIGRPSATSDGVGAPGSEVLIVAPTNGGFGPGTLNALKNVTIGQRKYVVGDCAPFRWFNAGDFGDGYILDDDLEQVFEAAVYQVNTPPPGSDFFDSMDSCCSTYGVSANGYLTNNFSTTTLAEETNLFDGDDTSINNYAFGDGKLDVTDVYVTLRRSLDSSLFWFDRFWTNGIRAAEITGNVYPTNTGSGDKLGSFYVVSPTDPKVAFYAGDAQGSPGQTLQIPITARTEGSYPLRVVMIGVTLEPLDGSPPITNQVQFTPDPALGAPTLNTAQGPSDYAGAWLDSTIPGLSTNALIGTLSVTLPATAGPKSSYAIHFNHASGSPNGLGSFPVTANTGIITLSDRSSSYFSDGIPDTWRLRHFGTIYNALSQAMADADGDGADNWQEYEAGTDPNDAQSVLKAQTVGGTNAPNCVIHWPSAVGINYLVQKSSSLYGSSWTTLTTNAGTGFDLEFHDNTPGSGPRFYRVQAQ